MSIYPTLASFGPGEMLPLMLMMLGMLLSGLVLFWWLLGLALKYWGSPKGVRVFAWLVSILGLLVLLGIDDDWSLMVGTPLWLTASVRSWLIYRRLKREA